MEHRPPLEGQRLNLGTRILDAAGLAGLDPDQWDSLGRHALVENPFYSRQYLLAGLETIDRAAGLRAFEIRTADDRLVALFPFVRRWGIACGARNLYQFSGTPLIHKDHAPSVVVAWLDAIASGRLPRVWRLRDLRTEGPLAALIAGLAAHRGMATAVVNGYRRPVLTRLAGGFEQHLGTAIAKSRRKDIERAVRRLREQGELRFERCDTADAVQRRIEQFLALERAGWKGAGGSAFLCRADDAAFARAAFAGIPGRQCLASMDSLLLDDRPIAFSINIASGNTAFTPKCTYDETYRKWSPGLVLEYLVIERFYGDGRFSAMDSATTVDGHVVEGLWNETAPMGELFVGLSGSTRLAALFAAAHAKAKSMAKKLLSRIARGRH